MHLQKLLPGSGSMLIAGLASFAMIHSADARRTTGQAPTSSGPSSDAPLEDVVMFQLENATIEDIQTAMREGSLTSVELVNLYLRRIQAYNQSSVISPVAPLNSILFLNPDVLEDAAQADRLRSQGIVLGPLHGIPFLVKGSIPIRDMPLSGGVNAWRNVISNGDAWCVEKLRQAGAVVMGHANMDSWASSATNSTSQIAGSVRNAYLQGALPGGSSGGSGVSAGAYLTNFTFGGETGGSIRNPGDRSGLVSYKVSGGAISVNKIIPLVPERDVIGPMTRNATDNAIVRDIVGVKDPADPWAPILPILEDRRKVPETGFTAAVKTATLSGKKIGVIGTYVGLPHPDPGMGATSNTTGVQTTTPATKALIDQMMVDMRAAGASIDYVFMPPAVSTTYPLGAGAPTLALNASPFSNQVASYVYRSVIEAAISRPDYTYSQNAEAVLSTASLTTNISAARRAMMYIFDGQSGTYAPGEAISFDSAPGREHYEARKIQKNAFEGWLDSTGLDAVVWPMFPNKTRTGGTIIGRDLVNFMHLPSVTVPIGKLTQVATASLPEGDEPLTMDITGRLFDDVKVLAIARAYEAVTQHRYSPPLAPPISGEVFDYKRQAKKPYVRDFKAPVLTASTTATYGRNNTMILSGTVADANGIDRLEVSIAGQLISAVVEGNTWTASIPGDAAANVFLASASNVDVLVLAVDPAGNATSAKVNVAL
jgi:amidase